VLVYFACAQLVVVNTDTADNLNPSSSTGTGETDLGAPGEAQMSSSAAYSAVSSVITYIWYMHQ
jgi:hypothetical protein